MKQIIFVAMLVLTFLLTGCTIEVGNFSTKAEEFASVAENLGEEFESAKEKMNQLESKPSLTNEDQELIVEQINELTKVIDHFQEKKAPFLVKNAKKLAVKELNKKEIVLLKIQNKASNGTATKEDITKIKEVLSDDIDINLFSK